MLAYARTMTWTGIAPVVELVTTTYKTGVKLTPQAMNELEKQRHRQLGWETWVVDIYPTPNDWDT